MLKVRKVEEGDRALLNAAALADPYHAAAGLTGEHWAGKDSIFYEDESGPVVALKTVSVVRADVQFLTQDRERNSKALMEGFWNYVRILQNRKVREVIFNSESPEVVHFFQKRFHFRPVNSGTFSLWIGD